MENNASTRMFRIRKTVYEMLKDRGFSISDATLNQSYETFRKWASTLEGSDSLTILASKSRDPDSKILVFFPREEKTDAKIVQKYYKKMIDEKIERSILVTNQKLSPYAQTAISQVRSSQAFIESFLESELLINITKHILVPKHIILEPEQKSSLLKRYRLSESQLPRIHKSDPVARYLGCSAGQVLKIIRPSETAGRYVSYRLVV